MPFTQYDAVRIKGFASTPAPEIVGGPCNSRVPQIGDIATNIEVYENPSGYELECSDSDGITVWLLAFGADEIDMELVV